MYKTFFEADNGTLIKSDRSAPGNPIKSDQSALDTQIKSDQSTPDTQIKIDRSTPDTGGILNLQNKKASFKIKMLVVIFHDAI